MARIGFFIQSSNQELFVNNTNVLKEYYRSVIEKNGYDIDLYSFVGDRNAEQTYEKGDTIYCKCNDRYPNKKYSELFDYIKKNKRYEFILITNNTTLTNLDYLWKAIDSLDISYYYCTLEMRNALNYPNGNVKLMHWETFLKISEVYDSAYYSILPVYNFLWNESKYESDIDNPYMWMGPPEDMIIGVCLYRCGIPYLRINEYYSIHEYLDAPVADVIDWGRTLFLTFKITGYYEDRLMYETEGLKDIIKNISVLK